jgi:hypothetical protein
LPYVTLKVVTIVSRVIAYRHRVWRCSYCSSIPVIRGDKLPVDIGIDAASIVDTRIEIPLLE